MRNFFPCKKNVCISRENPNDGVRVIKDFLHSHSKIVGDLEHLKTKHSSRLLHDICSNYEFGRYKLQDSYGGSLSGFTDNIMEGQNCEEQGDLHISDVIEVIDAIDPDYGRMNGRMDYDEGVGAPNSAGVFIKILEQPAPKALRFRYECEGRSAGSIPGLNSTPENKTYPTIQVVGYQGRAVVVVSCVTKDAPFRPHPHNLVGKDNCKKGVYTVEINNENMIATFANLGIQCVKKKDIEEALRIRKELKVDPFRTTKHSHLNQTNNIDLNSVRLCFQVFLEGEEPGKFTIPVPPVVSMPIYDKKAMADLVIVKLSHCSASVIGGAEIILLCEKVAKEDISVRFYEMKNGQIVWEGYGDFQPAQVHKQVAIAFRTPRYRTLEVKSSTALTIDQPVQVYIQLKRPSDDATSDALPFQLTPLDADPAGKKRKIGHDHPAQLRHLQEAEQSIKMHLSEAPTVKREPETSPNPYLWGYGGPKLSPNCPSRTPSPPYYQGGIGIMGPQGPALSPVPVQLPGMSPMHQPQPGVSPIHQPTQSNITFSGGTVFQQAPAPYPAAPAVTPLPQHQGMTEPSGDLMNLENIDPSVLENLSSVSISSDVIGRDRNMTDSLTRLATSRYEDFEI